MAQLDLDFHTRHFLVPNDAGKVLHRLRFPSWSQPQELSFCARLLKHIVQWCTGRQGDGLHAMYPLEPLGESAQLKGNCTLFQRPCLPLDRLMCKSLKFSEPPPQPWLWNEDENASLLSPPTKDLPIVVVSWSWPKRYQVLILWTCKYYLI